MQKILLSILQRQHITQHTKQYFYHCSMKICDNLGDVSGIKMYPNHTECTNVERNVDGNAGYPDNEVN